MDKVISKLEYRFCVSDYATYTFWKPPHPYFIVGDESKIEHCRDLCLGEVIFKMYMQVLCLPIMRCVFFGASPHPFGIMYSGTLNDLKKMV